MSLSLSEFNINNVFISDDVIKYQINKEGNQSIYEKTNISSEYLTQTDLISIENGGLDVYGKEELNKLIEDFE